MIETTKYGLKKPGESDYYDVGIFNENADAIEAELSEAESHRGSVNPHSGSEGLIKNAAAKESPVDADSVVMVDSADGGKTKRFLWSKVKAAISTALSNNYAAKTHATTHASNGSDAVTPAAIGAEAKIKDASAKGTPADADAVPLIDSEAGSATKRVLWSAVKEALKSYMGGFFVPLSRKVNGKALGADITLSAGDVGAAGASHTHTAADVGAAPTSHASSAATYGVGTTANYGHVKVTAGNGLAIASGAVSMAAASASAAGAVTTGTQTFAGAKTFSGAVVVSGQLTPGNPAIGTQAARRIYAGTGAMTDGVTALAQGLVYFQI